jgi:1-acyl-sn-glycerol-3-phosphate acyltransferase
MSLLKKILARFFAGWAMLSFITSFLIVFIPSMFCWLLPERAGQDLFIRIARGWMNVWLRIVGCGVRIRGKENFRKGETYIVTCNHNSLMDVPLSCPYIPGPNKTIAKASFASVPLFGWYYLKGSVMVDRNSEESRRKSYEKMKQVLHKGMHMSIYPEGTRNRSAEPLKAFQNGAFRLSVETGKSIIPAVIFNTRKVLPPGKKFWFWPTRIEMHFLPAISPAGLTTEQLKRKVFDTMWEYYKTKS